MKVSLHFREDVNSLISARASRLGKFLEAFNKPMPFG